MIEQLHIPSQTSLDKADSGSFLSMTARWSCIILVVAGIFQMIFFATITNFVAISSVIVVWLILLKFVLTEDMLRDFRYRHFYCSAFQPRSFTVP
jgi:hypothetical protein